jgi:hypothetical protein
MLPHQGEALGVVDQRGEIDQIRCGHDGKRSFDGSELHPALTISAPSRLGHHSCRSAPRNPKRASDGLVSCPASGYVVNNHHPEIMRSVPVQILGTDDVLGRDDGGRTILAVAVDDWLFDELAGFGADTEEDEPEPVEGEDPVEDEETP